jgi:hypothetical protein
MAEYNCSLKDQSIQQNIQTPVLTAFMYFTDVLVGTGMQDITKRNPL